MHYTEKSVKKGRNKVKKKGSQQVEHECLVVTGCNCIDSLIKD